MMNVDNYREYAADCVRQAQNEPTSEDRNMVLNMALAWLRLARLTETLHDETAPDVPSDEADDTAEDTPEDAEHTLSS